jgi:TolB-like protein/tetratricopeptide (TPR) repeat protein
MRVYKFRDCLINTAERSVIKEGEHLELTTKTFDVLEYLIENAGKVVSKDEILGHVWNGNFVEESNLPVHISKLRRSLSESRECRFIETVQGTGYRFVAPLRTVGDNEWQAASSVRRYFPGADKERASNVGHYIAVLPFHNEGGDSELEYLADGLTEALINGLSHVRSLKVIARDTVFSYKNRGLNIQDVRKVLGVSRILTGRVRLTTDRLTVGVEVIDAEDGSQLWGNQYNRSFSDIIEIQNEIVEVALRTLTAAVFPNETIGTLHGGDPESYRYYLMGKYLLGKRTTDEVYKSIEYFQRAVGLCPTNVHAYAATVQAYHLLHILDRISRAETLTHIEPILDILSGLNQMSDVVQLMYGKLKLSLDWRPEEAESYVHQALMLNPNLVDAHSVYAEIMIVRNRPSEAIRHANEILALDPISVSSLKQVGRIFYQLGKYSDALTYLQLAHELEPSDFEALLLLGASFAELSDYDEALRLLEMSFSCHKNIETLSMIGYVEALAGKTDRANRIIRRVTSEMKDHNSHPVNLARIHLAAGQKDEAYVLLEEAFNQRAVDLYGLTFDPRWKTIQSEARFKEIVRRVKDVRPTGN